MCNAFGFHTANALSRRTKKNSGGLVCGNTGKELLSGWTLSAEGEAFWYHDKETVAYWWGRKKLLVVTD